MTRCALRLGVLTLAAVVAAAQPARAQSPTGDRPFRGLFGGADTSRQTRESLTLLVSLFGAQDIVSRFDAPGVNRDEVFLADGLSAGGDANLAYVRPGRRLSFDAGAAANGFYHQASSDLAALAYSAHAGIRAPLGRRTTVRARASGAYAPYMTFHAFSGTVPGFSPGASPSADAATVRRRSASYLGDVGLDRAFSPRSNFELSYSYRVTDFLDDRDEALDLNEHAVRAAFGRQMSRNTSMRLALAYREGSYGSRLRENSVASRSPARTSELDLGVDRTWVLSATKRATFAVGGGPSVTEAYGDRWYQAAARASMAYPLGRTWTARASFRRGADFVEGFEDPFFSDAGTITLGGLLTRRFDSGVSGALSRGHLGPQARGSKYRAASASVRLRYAATRQLAVYTEYVHHFFRFSNVQWLEARHPVHLDRSSLRIGLTLWVPIRERN